MTNPQVIDRTRTASPLGTHRAVEPAGALPYSAYRLDTSLPLYPGEFLVEVEALNVDSASFTQLLDEGKGDPQYVAKRVMEIVKERGKMHNPTTGSGGVLIGTVKAVEGRSEPKVGDRLVTMASLTTTPLVLDEIIEANPKTHQVKVRGRAIQFARSPFAVLDGSLPEKLALAVLDVAGAPAQAVRLAKKGEVDVVVGAAGKSGLLCCWVAAQAGARVIAVVRSEARAARVRQLPFPIELVIVDGSDPVAMHDKIHALTGGKMADVVFNCVNTPRSEMGSILASRNRGTVYLFSMATSFQAAALGAEAIGADVDIMIGNGYADDHAKYALQLVKDNPKLREILEGLHE